MPLLQADWARSWSPDVYASDACDSGMAVVSSQKPLSAIAGVGRVPERHRYLRGVAAACARTSAMKGLDPYRDRVTSHSNSADLYTPHVDWILNEHFEEVTPDFVYGTWRVVHSDQFHHPDTMSVKECRAVVWAMRAAA